MVCGRDWCSRCPVPNAGLCEWRAEANGSSTAGKAFFDGGKLMGYEGQGVHGSNPQPSILGRGVPKAIRMGKSSWSFWKDRDIGILVTV